MPYIQIHIKGRIDPAMSDWFQGFAIEPLSPDESRLTGEAVDNSAVYGLMSTLSTLGITLISVSISEAREN
jgi:hypothetical protein